MSPTTACNFSNCLSACNQLFNYTGVCHPTRFFTAGKSLPKSVHGLTLTSQADIGRLSNDDSVTFDGDLEHNKSKDDVWIFWTMLTPT
jgi:hypothetical protein